MRPFVNVYSVLLIGIWRDGLKAVNFKKKPNFSFGFFLYFSELGKKG